MNQVPQITVPVPGPTSTTLNVVGGGGSSAGRLPDETAVMKRFIDMILDCNTSDDRLLSNFQKSVDGFIAEGVSLRDTEVLHSCVANDRVVLIHPLVSMGADINHEDHLGNTALHVAAVLIKNSAVRCCMELGADKNIRNKAKETAYESAYNKYYLLEQQFREGKIKESDRHKFGPIILEPATLSLIKTEVPTKKRNRDSLTY